MTDVAGVVLVVRALMVDAGGLAVAGGEVGADAGAGSDSVQVDAEPAEPAGTAAAADVALAVALAVAVRADAGKVAKIVAVEG